MQTGDILPQGRFRPQHVGGATKRHLANGEIGKHVKIPFLIFQDEIDIDR
jgi:hypothetical protein